MHGWHEIPKDGLKNLIAIGRMIELVEGRTMIPIDGAIIENLPRRIVLIWIEDWLKEQGLWNHLQK